MYNEINFCRIPPLFYHELNELINQNQNIDDLLTQYGIVITGEYNSLTLENLWKRIYNKHHNDVIIINRENNLNEEEIKSFLYAFTSRFENSYDKYSVLLGFYDAKKQHLMDKLNSTIEFNSKYNDTPQDVGNMNSDPYTTNTTRTKSTTESDSNTLMARLNEIQNSYRNLYMDWVNEFDGLFVDHLNGGV